MSEKVFDTNTCPAWLIKTPLQRFIDEIEQILDRAEARSADDYDEKDCPYPSLAGARQADTELIRISVDIFKKFHMGQGGEDEQSEAAA